jgi:hypothetical protein
MRACVHSINHSSIHSFIHSFRVQEDPWEQLREEVLEIGRMYRENKATHIIGETDTDSDSLGGSGSGSGGGGNGDGATSYAELSRAVNKLSQRQQTLNSTVQVIQDQLHRQSKQQREQATHTFNALDTLMKLVKDIKVPPRSYKNSDPVPLDEVAAHLG